ncbi:WxL domain-containing protein [Lactobacillus pentosus]|uniref:WxL domain-containing protein n=1 Tax=Lactiplantibacillus pentosus TaxID=1589 RepID=UPI00128BFDFC|nr:WxL domain-containing protein [Lactiplantibacillus pentosus]MCH4130250.1 WxL domain-containing protein [Lactiplantibacillus sp.]BBM21949.1 extracellular protein [Lactiplantibacillus plantarum]MCT3292103.1 WxL domain-containing protein [Lactiplantibacillus pentosus]MPQ18970.1 WxL domain-containing protein [Lactiplantibacillus pentosus]UXI97194.1 WxL domain-containing protein [Lactiplantibacillus pentosus]
MRMGLLVTGRLLMVAVSGLIISNWGWSVTTQAADRQSQVQVKLTPSDDDDAVSPVDPDDPSKPYPGDPADEGNVTGTGSRGKLTIDFVSNLKFKPVTTAGGPATVTAQNERAMIQVTDRRASAAGWTLQVTPSPLQSGQQQLTTSLKLGSVQLKPGTGNVSAAPNVVNTGELVTGIANSVVTAQPQSGLGTWLVILNRGDELTQLQIHDRQLSAGDYTGTLAWSLNNAPS